MGYLHIANLYKEQEILMFKECYALEKIHGTSAHVAYKDGSVRLFSGGAKHEHFAALFDLDSLAIKFGELGLDPITIYGEAYGGKMQKMGDTYGPDLKFVAFDVRVGNVWLSVPDMDQVASGLGFDVVPWRIVSTDVDTLNAERDRPSEQAIKCGCGTDKLREGVVLRPLVELRKNNDERIIVKHKGEAFAERVNTPKVRREKTEVMAEAEAIAFEWVTEVRLSHVLDKLGDCGIERTGDVIKAMVEDVEREASGEIVESKAARRAISARAAKMFKARLRSALVED